jgi:hypothetical protein
LILRDCPSLSTIDVEWPGKMALQVFRESSFNGVTGKAIKKVPGTSWSAERQGTLRRFQKGVSWANQQVYLMEAGSPQKINKKREGERAFVIIVLRVK